MISVNKKALLTLFIPIFLFSACRIEYSFTGTTLDYDVTRTFSVENFFNDAGGGPANMGQLFTESLKEYFQRNTQLELIRTNGDLQFEGSITRYSIDPQATVSSPDPNLPDRAGQMRLSIAVQVDFVNMQNDEESLSRTFSFFQDYDPRNTSLLQVETELIEVIFENIIQDIFTATVANW
ncbi:LptE family protein [Litoribacter ruber]|uniref:LptE family protein n=1 Tax=Litoribacter ruber TaxID=702568 RepID=A0AAP2CMV4_9BACT|nr:MULTISPECIES: LptE family protein [Litoribacter]MBS9524682.1 LptE family protein [Litoribacter alkaliphilus]MBT0812702.1 LptE family protein [Litoribacter ruber]